MSTPVPLRSDFDTIGLRMLARRSRDPDQTRRLLALGDFLLNKKRIVGSAHLLGPLAPPCSPLASAPFSRHDLGDYRPYNWVQQ
jgi:hypothetical protein